MSVTTHPGFRLAIVESGCTASEAMRITAAVEEAEGFPSGSVQFQTAGNQAQPLSPFANHHQPLRDSVCEMAGVMSASDPICPRCATQEHGSPKLPVDCACGYYPAAPDANGWMPIETAPHDQVSILGCHIRSRIMHVTWRDAVGSENYIRIHEPDGRGWRPTHWQPIPKPPVGAQ